MILNHCRVLFKAKQIHGVSKISTLFFLSWGLWNIFYYPHLNQLWSFTGGLFVVAANTLWISLMIHYSRNERSSKSDRETSLLSDSSRA